jgi:protocatechuate 3,4-dioxygenase beta subunit
MIVPRAAILIVTLSVLAAAQPQTPKAGAEGRVTNTAGAPLARATVALVGNIRNTQGQLPPAYRTTTASDGTFVFGDIEPNTYRLFVQRAGYLDFIYTQADGRVAIPIAAGDRPKLSVKMTAPSFLSGRITTEDGEPFPEARVNVFRLVRSAGKKQLISSPSVSAGPDGSFSIGRLIAGRYYLATSNPPSLTDTNQREIPRGKSGDERYVTTYYPSSLDTSGATLIDLPSEKELSNLDIRLRRARVFHISGKIVQASAGPPRDAMITLLRPGISVQSEPGSNANRIAVMDGAFQVNGLLPGVYTFQAWAGPNRQWQGYQSVTLSDHDLDDVVLTLTPSLDIPLAVRIEDADPQQTRTIANTLGRVTLTASDSINSNAMAGSSADGWMFHNIGPGTYRIGIGTPDGTYVKSIRFGEQDITRRELDTTSGGGSLVVTLSPHAAEITGVVRDTTGQPLANTTVTLWVAGGLEPGTQDQARSTLTDAAGKYRFGNLPPGEYRVAAWEKVDPGVPHVPEFHTRFDADATPVLLHEDSRQEVQPALVPRQKIETVTATLQ